MKFKKLTALLISVAMVATMLAGCGAKEEAAAPADDAAAALAQFGTDANMGVE
jgi:N-acetylglucosamine transport system substrate-binding protein